MLRNEPRNATVRARTSLEVIAVSRESFNMLVKSSNQTADEIARVAQERLGPAATAR
jgi:CRP-like cAMP-binding protein